MLILMLMLMLMPMLMLVLVLVLMLMLVLCSTRRWPHSLKQLTRTKKLAIKHPAIIGRRCRPGSAALVK